MINEIKKDAQVRMQKSLESLIHAFSRIRTGIGNPPGKMAVADYVLKQLRAREAEDFQDTCARAADAAGLAIVHGVIYARDHVNGAASANGKH